MSIEAESPQNLAHVDLLRYVRLFLRWLWLIILCALIAGGVTYYQASNTVPVYSTSAVLMVNISQSNTGGIDYSSIYLSQQMAATYIELLHTRQILDRVVERLQLPPEQAGVVNAVRAQAIEETQLIRLSITDSNPQRAADVVNTVAQVFQELIEEQQLSRYASFAAVLTTEMQQLEAEIIAIQEQIAAFPPQEKRTDEEKARVQQLQVSLNQYNATYSNLLYSLSQVRLAEAQTMSSVIVAEEARVPTTPDNPRTLQNVLLAALVGAVLAAVVVFVIDFLDDTVKSPEDIEQSARVPLLGSIARISGRQPSAMLVTALAPRSPVSEAYRTLRTNLQYSSIDVELRSILVSSATPSEGKSTTVANLAVVLAQSGNKVIIIDTDLRRPTQHRYFSLANTFGVTTAILDAASLVENYLQPTEIENLRVLTSGPLPPNPSELIDSQRLTELLRALREVADILILDSPPLLTVTDAAVLSRKVDGTLIVVEAGKTRKAMLAKAMAAIRAVDGKLLGVVMNRITAARSGYYANYYYYYSEEHGQKKET